MIKRQRKGSSIILVAVLTIILALIGYGIFSLVKILAGSHQVNTAVDAGNLNVAVAAALVPSVTLYANDPIESQIQSMLGNDPVTGTPYNVNMLNINKVIGWGFLIALNAAAEGTPAAITNAQNIQNAIEGSSYVSKVTGQPSITARLRSALINYNTQYTMPPPTQPVEGPIPIGPQTTDWVSYFFNQGILANPQSIANPTQKVTIQSADFKTSYVGAGDATNVFASYVTNNLPYTNIDTGTRLTNPLTSSYITHDGYIQGYVPIPIKSASGTTVATYYFVTNYGDQYPGLRTGLEFKAGVNSSGVFTSGSSSVILPPNSFYNQAEITLPTSSLFNKQNSNNSGFSLNQNSIATIGTKAFPSAIPNLSSSYIVFDNTPQQVYTGPFPGGCDNVICDELGAGMYVLPNNINQNVLFSTSMAALNNIANWWQAGAIVAQAPSTANVYTWPPGTNISTTAALTSFINANFKSSGATGLGTIITCTDQNSDPNDPNNISNCSKSISGFNAAYHPNASQEVYSSHVDGLTAGEMAKNTLFQIFNSMIQSAVQEYGNALYVAGSLSFEGLMDQTAVFNLYYAYTTNTSNGLVSTSTQPYPLISGLGQYWNNANPISNPVANIPWGTNGVYPVYSNYSPYRGLVADELGQYYCCSGADWVDTSRMGKVTKTFTLGTMSGTSPTSPTTPGIIDQTTTVNTSYYPGYYTEQVNNGTTTSNTSYKSPPSNKPSIAVYNWFVQRAMQMGATQAQAQSTWNSISMDINDIWCVFMNKSTTPPVLTAAKASVSLNQTGGPHGPYTLASVSLASSATNASSISSEMLALYTSYPSPFPYNSSYTPTAIDGKTNAYSQQYNILFNLVDAEYDYNVQDMLFYFDGAMINAAQGAAGGTTYPPNECLVATDYVFLESATGAVDGSLGRIDFKERADNGPGPTPPVSVLSMSNIANQPGIIGANTPNYAGSSCSGSSPPIMINWN